MIDMPCRKEGQCTGCGVCVGACPFSAIKLLEDNLGQYKPVIDKQLCKECFICVKHCPENNNSPLIDSIECYAAVSEDNYMYETTSSGGVATAIAEYIINEGGVVYGASFSDAVVKHIRVKTKKEVEYLKGSRYVQSLMTECLPQIKNDLINGLRVLFVGTPCQVAGVKSFLRNVDCNNLVLIDLVCHGVPPMAYLREYIQSLAGETQVQDVIFRVKDWQKGVNRECTVVYNRSNVHDLYCYAFAKSVIFRENCYSCRYAQPKRGGDVTVGDFWGIGETSLPSKSKSLVLINTSSGQIIWDACKSQFAFERRTVEEAIRGNSQLRSPSEKPDLRADFIKKYKKIGFVKALRYSPIGLTTLLLRIKHNVMGHNTKGGYGLIILKK